MKKFSILILLVVLSVTAISAQDDVANAVLLEDHPVIAYWLGLQTGESDPSEQDEFFTSSFQYIDAITEVGLGRVRMIHNYGNILELVPDLSIRVYEVVAGEDSVVIRYRTSGTFGEQPFVFASMAQFHLEEGKISSIWEIYNPCRLPNMECVVASKQ